MSNDLDGNIDLLEDNMMYKMIINKKVVELEMKSDDLDLLFDLGDEINKIIDRAYPDMEKS